MAYQTFTVTDKGLRLDYDLGDGKTKQKLLQTVPTSLDVGTTGTISQSDQGGIVLQGQGGAESFFQSGAAVDAYTSLADELAAQAQADTPTTDTTTDTGVFLADEEIESTATRMVEEDPYEGDAALAAEIGIEGEVHESLEDYVAAYNEAQGREMETATQTYGAATTADLQSLADYTAATQSSVDVAEAAMAPGREGIYSTGNIASLTEYEQVSEQRINAYSAQVNAAIQAREAALEGLQAAQVSQNSELINQYQAAYEDAKYELIQANTDLYNSMSDYANYEIKKQAQTESSLSTFTAMADTGVTLDPGTISSFADQLGISFDAALGYYEGAQAIRDDKSLSLEEKVLENAKLTNELRNEITGGALKAQGAINEYKKLVKSGNYTREELGAMAEYMGINTPENPVYQAELALLQAQSTIEKNTANGVMNPQDYLNYLEKLSDVYATIGTTDIYMPVTQGAYGLTATANGVVVNVNTSANEQGQLMGDYLDRGQCGEFVNDVLGTSFPDDKNIKLNMADPNMDPAPGTVAVFDAGTYGHVAIVESVDWDNYTMDLVESNWLETDTVNRRENVPITSAYGFMAPSDSTKITKQGGSTVSDDLVVSAMLASNGGKTLTTVPAQNMIKAFTVINQLEALSEALELGKKQTFSAGTDPETGELLETDKIDFSPLTGFIKSKNPWNADAKEVEAILTGTVPLVARGIFGEVGVLTDVDIALYKQTLPNLTQTDEVKTLVTAALLRTVSYGLGDQLETWAGLGYDVSGLVNKYQRVQQQVTALEESIGIGGSTNAGDQDLYDNGPIKQEQDELWDSA